MYPRRTRSFQSRGLTARQKAQARLLLEDLKMTWTEVAKAMEEQGAKQHNRALQLKERPLLKRLWLVTYSGEKQGSDDKEKLEIEKKVGAASGCGSVYACFALMPSPFADTISFLLHSSRLPD